MKPKYEVYKQYNIAGILDEDDDGKLMLIVEDEVYDFDGIIDELKGQFIEIKCSK